MRTGHVPALLLSLLLSTAASAAPISLTLSTSGYLLDAADHPLSQENLSVKFSLWTDPAATLETSRIWPESGESECLVSVVNGLYAAVLDGNLATGCGAGLSSAHLPPALPRYLQISVGGVTLTPRMRVGMVPNAAIATHALDAEAVGGEAPAALHDASKLTGVAPGTVLGTGSAGLTTVGTITTGTWQGTKIADAYLEGAATWNVMLAAVAHDGTLVGDGTAGANQLRVNLGTAEGTVAAGNDARFGQWTGLSTGLDAAAARTSLGLGTAATSHASAYATAAQGATAEAALPKAGGTLTGAVTVQLDATANTALNIASPGLFLQNSSATDGTLNSMMFGNRAAFGTAQIYNLQNGTNAGTQLGLATKKATGAWNVGQLVLDPSGNVGVGTGAPGYALDVVGDVRASGQFRGDGSGLTFPRLAVNNASSGYQLVTGATSGTATSLFQAGINGVSNGLTISTDASNNIAYSFLTGAGAQGLYQAGNGKVGIGTTSPQARLDIASSVPGDALRFNGKALLNILVSAGGYGTSGGYGVVVNGSPVGAYGRSWGLKVIAGSGASYGTVIYDHVYDVYGTAALATNFIADLAAYNTGGNVLIVHTFDEPTSNGTTIRDALKNSYGAKKVYPATGRDAYALVYRNGFGPLGECSSATRNASGTFDAQGNNSMSDCSLSVTLFL